MAGTITKKMKIRLIVIISFIVLALGWVIGNLAYRSLVTGQDLKVKASEQQLSDITIPANRGTIYDANMNVLAQSATVWNVQLSPLEINKYQDEAQRDEMVSDLSALLELEPEDVRKRLETPTASTRSSNEKSKNRWPMRSQSSKRTKAIRASIWKWTPNGTILTKI